MPAQHARYRVGQVEPHFLKFCWSSFVYFTRNISAVVQILKTEKLGLNK